MHPNLFISLRCRIDGQVNVRTGNIDMSLYFREMEYVTQPLGIAHWLSIDGRAVLQDASWIPTASIVTVGTWLMAGVYVARCL